MKIKHAVCCKGEEYTLPVNIKILYSNAEWVRMKLMINIWYIDLDEDEE